MGYHPRRVKQDSLQNYVHRAKIRAQEIRLRKNPEQLKEKPVAKGINYLDSRDPEVAARILIENQNSVSGIDYTKKMDPVISFALVFEEVLGEYLHKPTLKWVNAKTPLDPKSVTYCSFRTAMEIAKRLKAPYDEFFWAQFYFYDKKYARPPKPHELRIINGFLAVDRNYFEYIKLKKEGKIYSKPSSIVLGTVELSYEELDKINQKRVKDLMVAWDTNEKTVFEMFTADGMFDIEWLRKQPIYPYLKKNKFL